MATGYRERLHRLLADSEREDLRLMENRVVAKLPPPNRALAALLPSGAREHWLAGWKPRTAPYRPDEDVWFRQAGDADVRELLRFLEEVLPSAVNRFLERAGSP